MEQKYLRLTTQKGKAEELRSACITPPPPAWHCSVPRRNSLAKTSSSCWEKESEVSDQLPQAFGILHKGSALVSPCPETVKGGFDPASGYWSALLPSSAASHSSRALVPHRLSPVSGLRGCAHTHGEILQPQECTGPSGPIAYGLGAQIQPYPLSLACTPGVTYN